MDFNVSQKLSELDSTLLTMGKITHEEHSLLQPFITVRDWVCDRSKFAKKHTLLELLSLKLNIPTSKACDLEYGFWHQNAFTPYEGSVRVYLDDITDESIALGAGLYQPSDSSEIKCWSSGFWGKIPAFNSTIAPKSLNSPMVISDKNICVEFGHKKLPFKPLEKYIGPLKAAIQNGDVSAKNQADRLWGGVVSKIASATVGANNLYILSGASSVFVIDDLVSKGIKAIKANDVTTDDFVNMSGITVVISTAMSLSSLLADLSKTPTYLWIGRLAELHIKFELPELCEHCRVSKAQPAYSHLHLNFALSEGERYFPGAGCDLCYMGYTGSQIIEEKVDIRNKGDFLAMIDSYLLKVSENPHKGFFEIYPSAYESKYLTTFKQVHQKISVGKVSIQDIESFVF